MIKKPLRVLYNRPLNLNTDSFSSFKSPLFKYYESSLYLCYNVDDPRSYKTICPKCNSVRSLTTSLSCCMQKLFQCFCRCYVYVAVCNVALNCYLIFGTAVIGLHAVADFLQLCM